ncbi:MAG: peptidoglycan-binding domain-containing protein, partial [Actinomycetales bacterium]
MGTLDPSDREAVRSVQVRLANARYLSLVGVSLGSLDAATTAAIARFQLARGLPSNGVCD